MTLHVACAMPHPMFETWFAAAASSLAGVNDLPADLTTPANPEDNGLGKGWLKKQLSRKYIEPVDQLRFTAGMDLALCRQQLALVRQALPRTRPTPAAGPSTRAAARVPGSTSSNRAGLTMSDTLNPIPSSVALRAMPAGKGPSSPATAVETSRAGGRAVG